VDQKKKEKIAVFRFGVISRLVALKKTERGQKKTLIRDITSRQWDIPFSGRSYISRSTVLQWLKKYEDSGRDLKSLYPTARSDRGRTRSMDEETERALVNLKREHKGLSLPMILKMAHAEKILPPDFTASPQTIYRLFHKHGLHDEEVREDMRQFESELPNDLWQSDCMHGPEVIVDGKARKTFLFAFIDDHSRLIPHAEFYTRENLDSFTDCLQKAFQRRGLPRKLYVDNGPTFRAHHLQHITASLGIALLHCTPYRPEGKGKIERWFLTVRMRFLPLLPPDITLSQMNERFHDWKEKDYHLSKHSVTRQQPLQRYLKHLHLVRAAPKNLTDYFRKRVIRTVDKDRTLSLCGKVYEAPGQLIGKRVTLLYHEEEPEKIEVFFKDKSFGFIVPLNAHINCRIKRKQHVIEIAPSEDNPTDRTTYEGGKLFDRSEDDDSF
jgi:putative transposase